MNVVGEDGGGSTVRRNYSPRLPEPGLVEDRVNDEEGN